jgi:hypothetical protein
LGLHAAAHTSATTHATAAHTAAGASTAAHGATTAASAAHGAATAAAHSTASHATAHCLVLHLDTSVDGRQHSVSVPENYLSFY